MALSWRRGALVVLALLATSWLGLYAWAHGGGPTPVVTPPYLAHEPSRPWVIAHRGGAGLRPENTLVAFEHARALGVDVIELDVRRSRDGALVVIHDATVDRTTDGAGRVDELDLDALRQLNAGARFVGPAGERFGARIPTLEEVLGRLPQARINIEMKADGIAPALCDLLRAHRATERAMVASAASGRMKRFRERCPEVATSATFGEALWFWSLAHVGIVADAPAPALQLPHRLGALPVFAAPLRWASAERRIVVDLFTVNTPAEMDALLEAGVHGIMTDRPDLLVNRFARE